MARPDWAILQKQFLSDHEKTGISPKEWCDSKELRYATARRYIKNPIAQKTAQNETRKLRSAQKRKMTNYPPFETGNKAAIKHSGYAKYMRDSDELFTDAGALDLMQELLFVRARALSVTKVIAQLRTDFDEADNSEVRANIAKQIINAEQAIDRNLARIESLERTLVSLDIDRAILPKVIAETEFRQAATRKIELEAEKIRKEIDPDNKDKPITRMEVVIVGENNQGNTNTSTE